MTHPAAHYSTVQLPLGDRCDYWRSAISDTYVPLDFEPLTSRGAPKQFFGEIELYSVGDIRFTTVTSSPQIVKRTSDAISKSSVDYFLINIQRAGQGWGLQDGRRTHLSVNDIAVYDATKIYEIGFSESFRQTVIKIPYHDFIERLPFAPWATASTISTNDGLGRVFLRFVNELLSESPENPLSTACSAKDVLLDLITLAISNTCDNGVASAPSNQLTKLRIIQSYIDENIASSGLSPAVVAAEHRMSVRYLNKLFDVIDTSPARAILRRRLELVRSKLSDRRCADLTIGEISYRAGFSDLAHFSRAFKKEFGMTASDFRENPSL